MLFIGYEGSSGISKPVQYLLKKIDPKDITLLDEEAATLKVEEKYIHEPAHNLRVVYQTVLLHNLSQL